MNEALLRRALRLARILARRHTPHLNEEDRADVLQAAEIAAWRAVGTWDPHRGEWATHAFQVIRRAIWREMQNVSHLGGPGSRRAYRIFQEEGAYPAWAAEPGRLDHPATEEHGGTWEDCLPGPRFEEEALDRVQVEELLAQVTRRQEVILRLHVGEERSFAEIAPRFGISRQGVHFLSKAALAQLRAAAAERGIEP